MKQTNDKLGHDTRDRALRLFERALRSSLQAGDVAARYGGEEFAMALPNAFSPDVVTGLERVRENLALAILDGRPASTSSFGLAMSDLGSSFDEIVAAADEALFAAKKVAEIASSWRASLSTARSSVERRATARLANESTEVGLV